MDSELREAVKKFIEDWRPAMDGFYRKTPYNAFIPLIAALRAVPVSEEKCTCEMQFRDDGIDPSCPKCHPASPEPARRELGDKDDEELTVEEKALIRLIDAGWEIHEGLDANCTPRCGLSYKEWSIVLREHRDALIEAEKAAYVSRPSQPAAQSADVIDKRGRGECATCVADVRYQHALDVLRVCEKALDKFLKVPISLRQADGADYDLIIALAACRELIGEKP